MRVLITGGAGFIGSHLADALVARGDSVVILDDLSTGRRTNIDPLIARDAVEWIEGTILNPTTMRDAMDGCDLVFHMAAAVGVRLIMDAPVHTIRTNVEGTSIVLHEASRRGTRLMMASTSEVYGKLMAVENEPLREDADWRLGPTSVRRWAYAATKAVDEFLALALHAEEELPVTIVRHFNTVGPRQRGRYGMVLPRFVRAGLLGEPIEVHGDGTQSRCFCHVKDAVRALLDLAACSSACGEVVNVGSAQEVSIMDLAQTVQRETGQLSALTTVPYQEAFSSGFEDMQRRTPSLDKLAMLIGSTPQTSLLDIVRDVIDDQRARLDRGELD
ncbi:MAG: NAD-dependent epimerase/dehydratase family protein [Planctomycetota bacterium]|nr:NAD-dependent epimerase/dehydratase family protein [Planctomycetota bacterium]